MEVARSQASIEGLFTSEHEHGNAPLSFGIAGGMQHTTAGNSVEVLGPESHDERSLNDQTGHVNSALGRLDATTDLTPLPNEARSSGFGGAGGPVDIAAQRRLLGGRPKQRRVCHICGRECPSKHKLKRHLSTHSEDRPYNCRVCGRSFKWSEYLSKHMRQQHSVHYVSDNASEGGGHICQAVHAATDQTSSIEDEFDASMDASVDQGIDMAAAEDTLSDPVVRADTGFVSPGSSGEEPNVLVASHQHQIMTSPDHCLQHHQQLQQHQYHHQQQQQQQQQHQQQQHLCQLQQLKQQQQQQQQHYQQQQSFQQQQQQQQQQSTAVDIIQQLGIALPNSGTNTIQHLSHIDFSPAALSAVSCAEKTFSFPAEQVYTSTTSSYPGAMTIAFPIDLNASMQSAATSTYAERALFNYGSANICMSHSYGTCNEPHQVVATMPETSTAQFVTETSKKVTKREVASVGIQCEVGPETLAALREEEAKMFPLVSEGLGSNIEDQSVLLGDGCSFEESNSADLLSPVYSQGSEKFIQKFPCEYQDCGKAYVHRKDLIRHMRIRHGLAPKNLTPIPVEAPAKPHICQITACGRSYFHMKDLRRHQRQCHAVPLASVETEGHPAGAPMCKGMLRYPCDFASCTRSYVHKKDLIRHKRIFHKDSTPIPTIPTPVHYTDAELKKIRHELKLEVEGGCHCQRLDSTGSMISGGEDMGEEMVESDLATLSAANIMQSLSTSGTMVGMYDTAHALVSSAEVLALAPPGGQNVPGSNPISQQISSSSPQGGHMASGMLIESSDLDSYTSGIALSTGNNVAIVHPAVYSYPYGNGAPVAAYTYVDTQAGLQQQDTGGQFDDATTAAVLSALASTGNVSQLQNMMNQLLQ